MSAIVSSTWAKPPSVDLPAEPDQVPREPHGAIGGRAQLLEVGSNGGRERRVLEH